jgi:twitching motility protein PilU
MSRIISFYPLENRPALLADLSVTLRCVISQRLIKKPDGARTPAVEVMLNSRHIAELIEKGDLNGMKEAMEQSMSPGSQTFEQALVKLYRDNVITLEEAMANADSANNLHWLINNTEADADKKVQKLDAAPPGAEITESGASFSEFTLNMDAQ